MKRLAGLICMLMIFAAAAAAQETAATANPRSHAFVFTVAGLGDFQVGGSALGIAVPSGTNQTQRLAGLGYKFYISDKMAVRAALHVGYATSEASSFTGSTKTTALSVGLAPGLEYHFIKTRSVTAYYGLAAAVGYYSADKPGEFYQSTTTKFTGTVYSAALLAGVEFFPLEAVSLGAEYQLSVSASSGKSAGAAIPKTLAVGVSIVAASLSIYW